MSTCGQSYKSLKINGLKIIFYLILRKSALLFALILLGALANFDGARADTAEIRMDGLMATFPYFQDAQDRKEELPGIMEVWRDALACISAVDPHKDDLRACVESVHVICVGRIGAPIDSNQRDCWDKETFAWMLLRQDARDNLIAKVAAQAAESPKEWPKISDEEDYGAGTIAKFIREYDVAADQLNKTACGIDIALMGYDPGRGSMPLIAINRTYSCAVDAQVAVLQKS